MTAIWSPVLRLNMSFRTRIFVISCLIVGAVLAVVMGLTWTRIVQGEADRLDDRMCIEAKGLASLPANDTNGMNRVSDLAMKLRVNDPIQLLLQVHSQKNGVLLQSAYWQDSLSLEKIDWSKAVQSTGLSENENQPTESCKLGDFEHQERRWRAALFTRSDIRSFIATDRSSTTQDLRQAVQSALVVVIPLALLLSAFAAWLLANVATRPVNRLSSAMETVTQKDLHHRLPNEGEDREFNQLIETYNAMLDRLERSFQQASRFSADAAHELKTPLTILRGQLEQVARSDDPNRLDLSSLLDEVGKLSSITRKLLLLSQADAGRLSLHSVAMNLDITLRELIEDLDELPNGKILKCSIGSTLRFDGDDVLIHQLFNNLISNAIRYSTPGAAIELSAHMVNWTIEIIITNPCAPLTDETRKQLFDRFFRGDPAHNSYVEGSGLGLSLAREIARAHRGDLVLLPSSDDRVSMKLTLPTV